MGSSCPVAPPCTLVLLTACRRRSLLLLLLPSRSRSLLLLSASTPYGSVAPSWLPSPPSRPCGSPRKNMKNLALALSTASASKLLHISNYFVMFVFTTLYEHLIRYTIGQIIQT